MFVLLAKSIFFAASLLELITKSKEDHNERNVNHLIDCASKEVKANCITKKKRIEIYRKQNSSSK
ncbi:TPA: hypothetical protein QCX73_005673 [Bacillus mycoides]|nr:hypothetical protein [Bacillus mycoides]